MLPDPARMAKCAKRTTRLSRDLAIIGIDVQRNRRAVLRRIRLFVRQELTLIDDQPLTARPDRGDAAIFRAVEHTVGNPKGQAAGGQQDRAGVTVALKFDIR